MSFRNLRPALMAAISNRWRDKERDRSVLEKLPIVRSMLPIIDQAHQNLVRKQSLLSAVAAEIKVIQNALKAADIRHDRKMRGVHQILTGFAEAADDADMAVAILALRDRLMPEGLVATTRAYAEEAGDARMVWGRLDEKSLALVHSLPVPGGTVADLVNDWIQSAMELEELEQKRQELMQQRGSEVDVMSPAQARSASNEWIRMARALEINMSIDPEVTDEIRERILGPLYRQEAIADRRYGNGTADDTAGEDEVDPAGGADADDVDVGGEGGEGTGGEQPDAETVPVDSATD